jgi:hypothetical protein
MFLKLSLSYLLNIEEKCNKITVYNIDYLRLSKIDKKKSIIWQYATKIFYFLENIKEY